MNPFNFIKKNFSLLIIAALVIVILLQRTCTPKNSEPKEIIKIDGKKYEVIKRVTDTLKIPVIHNVYKKGEDIYHEIPVYVDVIVPSNIDTGLILKKFYATHVYKDTLHLKDSLGFIAVTDSISKNKLVSRSWNAKVNKTTINNTIYLKELSNQFYLGGSLGMQRPGQFLLGGNAILKTKTDKVFGLGVGVNSQLQPYFQGSMLWKISFKK
jgi:hypothetical protein